MNKYSHLAMRHWQTTDPDRHRAIPETAREALFTQLGEQADTEIQQLQDALAGPDPAGESYLEKVGRVNMARLQAEERVLGELILIPAPENTGGGGLRRQPGAGAASRADARPAAPARRGVAPPAGPAFAPDG